MNIVIAIDSFKGSLTSLEAGHAIADGILRADPSAHLTIKPLADGGEGTVEAISHGKTCVSEAVTVTGPLGSPVVCEYHRIPAAKTAILEMAGAAGLTLVPENRRNPLYTTTYGVGEVIKDAMAKGCQNFIVGIGGSATNDGGAGMLQALGYEFLTADNRPIPPGAFGLSLLKDIRSDHVLPMLSECRFRVASDVTNVLCGVEGCSAVYGPQKGASPSMIRCMDQWLSQYAALAARRYPKADPSFPGSGAAGGLGFAFLTFTNASLESGIQIVLEESGLAEDIKTADLVITGEGRLDGQSAMGKAPVGVARLAKTFHKPVVALAGSVTEEARECNRHGIDAFFPILRSAATLEEAMEPKRAKENLAAAAEQILRLFQIR